MFISNGTKLAICKYRRWVYDGHEFQHILEWYRQRLKHGA